MTEKTTISKRASRFWDRHADKYAARPVDDEAAYQKKLQTTQEYFCPDMEVLEVGCGTGTTALIHAPHVKHILATDVSARMIEIARAKAEAQGITNVTFEQHMVEYLDAAPAQFDAVLALSLLHLLKDWRGEIARAYKILKPGGIYVTSTVCLGDRMKWFALIGPVGRLFGAMPLVRVIKQAQLREAVLAAGFELAHEWHPEGSQSLFVVAKKPA